MYFGCDSDYEDSIDYFHNFGGASDDDSFSETSDVASASSNDTRSSDGKVDVILPSHVGVGADVYFDEDLKDDFKSWLESPDRIAWKPEDVSEEKKSDAAPDIDALMMWALDKTSHHTNQYGFAHPPEFPFIIRFDPRKCILAMSFANVLCIDIDEKDGMSKREASELIRKKATSKGLKFRLYETDHGLHAYCTSKIFGSKERETWSLMEDMHCDQFYIACSAVNGFSYRLAPKTLEEVDRRSPMSKDAFMKQFVKKPWNENPVVGKGKENQALVSLVNMLEELAKFTIGIPELYEKINSNIDVDDVLREVTNEAVILFTKAKARDPKAFSVWLQEKGTFNVPYMNSVVDWVPCRKNPRNIRAKHPDGKPITIFESKKEPGRFAWVHNNDYSSRTFATQSEAKQDVKIQFGSLHASNVQPRFKPRTSSAPQQASSASSDYVEGQHVASLRPESTEHGAHSSSSPPYTWRPHQVSEWVANLFTDTPYAKAYSDTFEALGVVCRRVYESWSVSNSRERAHV
eukprot:TRINITY_DN14246_c0_g4_i1.p1 TRINITY_DN14246_c0_g4~~TRINITY_DN14246_c0_g4_i1.p1  ORF type:complete len:519 (+),score=77.68 TRINITY_DN14246_c0_g4_i1:157-1713(+)